MPELKPLPCPHCGITSEMLVLEPCGTDEYSVQCRCCGMCGPVGCPGEYDRHNGDAVGKAEVEARENAIEAWNALPRALPWTDDPPTVAGDCYVRTRPDAKEPWDKPFVVFFSEGYLKELKSSQLMQFAGPIPAPVEE